MTTLTLLFVTTFVTPNSPFTILGSDRAQCQKIVKVTTYNFD